MWLQLVEKLLTVRIPDIRHPDCLRARHKRHECQKCVAACPIQAIKTVSERPVIDAEICDSCGCCIYQCPVDAVGEKNVYKQAETKARKGCEITLSCRKCSVEGSLVLPCLAFLSPAFVMRLIEFQVPVEILYDQSACQNCPQQWNRDETKGWLEDLADEFNGQKIRLSAIRGNSGQLSRRGFLVRGGNNLTNGLNELLGEYAAVGEVSGERTPDRKKIQTRLKTYLKQFVENHENHDISLSERVIRALKLNRMIVDSSCNLCGRCSVLCPTGALKITDAAEKTALLFDVVACIGCGICRMDCKSLSSIPVAEELTAGKLSIEVLKVTDRGKCSICQAARPVDNEYCGDCSIGLQKREQLLGSWI